MFELALEQGLIICYSKLIATMKWQIAAAGDAVTEDMEKECTH